MADLPEAPIRTVQQNALPGERVDSSAPISAFGGGDGVSQAFNASQNLAGQAQDLASQEIRKTNAIATNQELAGLKQKQTQIQLAASQLKGQDALGAQDFVDKQWKQAVQDSTGNLTNGAQKQMLTMHANDLYDSMYKTTQTHMEQQRVAWDQQSTGALIDNAKANAVLNYQDPSIVQQNVDTAKAAFIDHAGRMGVRPTLADGSPNPIYENSLRESLSPLYTEVLQAHIDNGNTDGAKEILEQAKGSMTPQDQLKISKSLEMGKDIQLGNEIWNDVQGYKLADGRLPNEAKMQANIMARDDLSDEKKQRMIQFVERKANDSIRQMNMSDQANNTAFQNWAVTARKQGMSLDDALQGVTKFPGGAADQATKEAAIQKMYAPPDITDVHTKVALSTGIDDGTVTKQDIDGALNKGLINDKDYFTLSTDYHKATVEGRSPQAKAMNSQIRQDAVVRWGGDKEKVDAFIDAVNVKAQGKAPEEKYKIATDELKAVPGTGFWGMFTTPQYDTDHKKDQASTLALGMANQDLGADVVRSLKAGADYSKAEFGPNYINDIANKYGGYDNMKPGKPVYQAIQILKNAQRPVTGPNIQAIFDNGLVKNPVPPPAQAATPAPAAAPAPAPTKTTQAANATGKKSGLDKFKEDFSPSDYTKNVIKGAFTGDGS